MIAAICKLSSFSGVSQKMKTFVVLAISLSLALILPTSVQAKADQLHDKIEKRGYHPTGNDYSTILGIIKRLTDIIYNKEPKNVALGKKTIQSSIHAGGDPGRAVDGNTDSYYGHRSCTHTALPSTSPWWRVDLGKKYSVLYLKITNRADCCSEKLSGFEIRIGDSLANNGNNNPKCHTPHSLKSGETRKIICRMNGRYVNIRIPGLRKILTLCEVAVYA